MEVDFAAHSRGQHVTVDVCSNLVSATSPSLAFTNSLLTAVVSTGVGSPTYAQVVSATSGTGIYTNVGAASYYLVDGSTNRDAGGTGLDVALANDLKLRTTYPPAVITTNLTNITVLSPRAGRDTNTPDLGYHYDPLDYVVFSNAVTANLTLTNGVALGAYGTSAQYGLSLNSGNFLSEGAPTKLNWIARYNTVQEQSTTNWSGSTVGTNLVLTSTAATVNVRFTGWSLLGASGAHYRDKSSSISNPPAFSHSRFGGGSLFVDAGSLAITNCLWERVYVSLKTTDDNAPWYVYNNLFFGGTFTYRNLGNTTIMQAYDNLFDRTIITRGTSSEFFTHDYNGYVTNQNRLTGSFGPHDVILTNAPVYLTNFFGCYYYPTNDGMLSTLINAGSRNADTATLYHFTSTTNQVKETNSVVDIGFHYVATDSSSNPLDSDGDGVADYWEDLNGNGSYDSGSDRSHWQNRDTDSDGRTDGEEVNTFGTDPKTANAPTIATQPQSLDACPGGTGSFFVVPNGSATTNYAFQWRFNGANISSATDSTYTRASLGTSDAGSYTVVITNSAGSVTSAVATLRLCGEITYTNFADTSLFRLTARPSPPTTPMVTCWNLLGPYLEITTGPAVHSLSRAFV